MAAQIVHLATIVQTTFGIVDDDGNVIPQQPLGFQVTQLNTGELADVFKQIIEKREQMAASAEQQLADQKTDAATEQTFRAEAAAREGRPPNRATRRRAQRAKPAAKKPAAKKP